VIVNNSSNFNKTKESLSSDGQQFLQYQQNKRKFKQYWSTIPPISRKQKKVETVMVDIQPRKRALGGNIYLELTEWNVSKRVDLRFWKDATVPTKEGVILHLDQWKALCNMSDVIDDLLTRVIEIEPVE
jgi:hypothetical protein